LQTEGSKPANFYSDINLLITTLFTHARTGVVKRGDKKSIYKNGYKIPKDAIIDKFRFATILLDFFAHELIEQYQYYKRDYNILFSEFYREQKLLIIVGLLDDFFISSEIAKKLPKIPDFKLSLINEQANLIAKLSVIDNIHSKLLLLTLYYYLIDENENAMKIFNFIVIYIPVLNAYKIKTSFDHKISNEQAQSLKLFLLQKFQDHNLDDARANYFAEFYQPAR
jgi:hypothetical protein